MNPIPRPRLIPLLAALLPWLMSPLAFACSEPSPALVELRVTSDRGEGFDRVHRIRVDAEGCVAVRRPPFHRLPGVFVARVEDGALLDLQTLAADRKLRAIDPQQALRDAEAGLVQRARAEGALRRHYISHPTGYVLRLQADGEVVELKAESIFQQAELHPESAELAMLAEAIAAVLALDALPDLAPEAQP